MQKKLREFFCGVLIGTGVVVCSSSAMSATGGIGHVGFWGRVSDASCTISLNGFNQAGSGNVWLSPISLTEIRHHAEGTYMKPQPFTLVLSHCRLHPTDNGSDQDERRYVSIRWGETYVENIPSQQPVGYLANTLQDGASNIYLALATNGHEVLDERNQIVPTDPLQNQVPIMNGGVLTYYIGYVTVNPQKVTTGPIIIRATWEIAYH